MKKNILFIFIVCIIARIGKTQILYIPLFQTGNQWNVKTQGNFPFSCYTKIYKVSCDTVINSKLCKKIIYSTDSSLNAMYDFYMYVYEDTIQKKVYLFDNLFNQKLYFDFSASINDTLVLTSHKTYYSGTVIITEVKDTLLNGVNRRKIVTRALNDYTTSIWYTGIGSLYGLSTGAFQTVGTFDDLLCYSKNNVILYTLTNECYMSNVGFEEIKTGVIQLYPNPASTNVKLKLNPSSKSATLQVFTLWGNKVESRDLPAGTSEYTLLIAHYSKGIYMIHLQYSDGTQATSKMVKQ